MADPFREGRVIGNEGESGKQEFGSEFVVLGEGRRCAELLAAATRCGAMRCVLEVGVGGGTSGGVQEGAMARTTSNSSNNSNGNDNSCSSRRSASEEVEAIQPSKQH